MTFDPGWRDPHQDRTPGEEPQRPDLGLQDRRHRRDGSGAVPRRKSLQLVPIL
jgi:hypothetical protein